MAKQYFKQFRYNLSDIIDKSKMTKITNDNGEIIGYKYNNITYNENYAPQLWNVLTNNEQVVRLGIQGFPGMYFSLNESAVNIDSDIYPSARIGGTGIFELDLTGTTSRINSIEIEFNKYFPSQWATPILVDIIYEESGDNS